MSGFALLCSGQGFQHPDIFARVADMRAADPIFAVAGAALGADPRSWVRAPGAPLHANRPAQILCCTQALAAWAALRGQVGRPRVIGGYSVGELAAWGIAGALREADVPGLAAERAEAMDAASVGPAGLVALRGPPLAALRALCARHGAEVAIVTAADRAVVGGTRAALDTLAAEAASLGAHATPLRVAVAAHTTLLRSAVPPFRDALARRPAGELPRGVRLLCGLDGATVFDRTAGLDRLARQLAEPIDWAACLDACRAAGIGRALELGPGTALARMLREAAPEIDARGLEDFRSLAGVAAWLR